MSRSIPPSSSTISCRASPLQEPRTRARPRHHHHCRHRFLLVISHVSTFPSLQVAEVRRSASSVALARALVAAWFLPPGSEEVVVVEGWKVYSFEEAHQHRLHCSRYSL